jgi:hypothetical protein
MTLKILTQVITQNLKEWENNQFKMTMLYQSILSSGYIIF